MTEILDLGQASLRLTADTRAFDRHMAEAHRAADDVHDKLEALSVISEIADRALGRVRLSPGQAAESRASASAILKGVNHISEGSLAAAHELDRVRLTERQAAASEVPASLIGHMLDRVTRKANESRRALESVRIVGGLPGRTGVGFGPLGSGYGRVGVLGGAVGLGALTAPAAGPAAVGLLAAIPTLAFTGVGALGSLALAFRGVGKAIGGDEQAFKKLTPAAQRFVQTVRSLHGFLDRLRATAQAGIFPGLTAGLRAALSPGTVAAITKAVSELSAALGQAFAAWGTYFGSRQFQQLLGPLMRAGARNIRILSTAMLSLFDALSVVARSAIPFTTWMNSAIARGARFASTWLRAKEATGALGRAMSEARTSLRLVGGLFASLLRVVGALGRALYPVAKVAVKNLTNGLNALAMIINRNKGAIRAIAGTLLTGLVTAVQLAVGAVRLFNRALSHIVGNKARVVTAVLVIGAVIAATLGPQAAVIAGALLAVGLIRRHWRGLVGAFKGIGKSIKNGLHALWVWIERGALKAALKAIEPFSHLPSKAGAWARHLKDTLKGELADLDIAGAQARNRPGGSQASQDERDRRRAFADSQRASPPHRRRHRHHHDHQHGAAHSGAPPQAPAFGTPPPFTTNEPEHRHRRHLSHLERLKKATREREEHQRAIQDRLQFAVDKARLAVENAKKGTAAYNRAVKAEDKALRAEIRYYDRRAHNVKLPARARDKALRAEIAAKKQLAGLHKKVTQPGAAAAAKNEAQFLSSFSQIVSSFAPNAFPVGAGAGGSGTGKMETKLHEVVHELRGQTGHLRHLVSRHAFPATGYAISSAGAVAG